MKVDIDVIKFGHVRMWVRFSVDVLHDGQRSFV